MLERIVVSNVSLLISIVILFVSDCFIISYICNNKSKGKKPEKEYVTNDNEKKTTETKVCSEEDLSENVSLEADLIIGEKTSAQYRSNGKRSFNLNGIIISKEEFYSILVKTKSYLIISGIIYFVYCVMLTIFSNGKNNWNIVVQTLIYFEIVFAIAYVDKKIKKIPNQLIIALMILRLPGLIIDIILEPSLLISKIIAPILGFACGAIIVLAFMLISRGGIGAGDMKLFAVTGLYFGLVGLLEIMFYSMFLASLTSIVLLLTKKAKFKSTLPMAPFICIGSGIYIVFAFVRFSLPV